MYSYPIAYPLTIIEGPIVMLISGFLIRLGLLDFWPLYPILMAGDLTGDIVWYSIGRHGARKVIDRWGKFFNLTQENVERSEKFFHEHQVKILFISKITMGFGFALATLVAAGAVKVPFKKYILTNFLGQFIWTAFLVGIGYFLGNLYVVINNGLRWAFLGAAIVILGAAAYGISRFMKNRFDVV
jgi:membrane protein DedA with SNARE-associated domain